MIKRIQQDSLLGLLAQSPAVALLGPRQVGKTTLAEAGSAEQPSIYLDLETQADPTKLTDAAAFLGRHEDKLVILDEVHKTPELFQ